MPVYTVKLKTRREVAEGTMAFYLDKPAGFEFAAGQSIDVTLLDPSETDARGKMRTLSLASAPHESDLMVATRMRDTAFKRELKRMPIGALLQIEGPFGFMTLHKNAAPPAVLLAGGIGITPFRSMLCQEARVDAGHHLFLFYSNRRPQDAAFLSELQELTEQNPGLKLIATMTNSGDSGGTWGGETGYINKEMLGRYVGDLSRPVYYIAGPQTLEFALREMLQELGVDEDRINSEGFAGY